MIQCANPSRRGELVGVRDVCGWRAGKAGLVGSERIYRTPSLDSVLHQPVASQVYLLQLTPARSTILMLLMKVAATVTVYREHRRTLISARDYLIVHHVCRNYLKQFFGRRTHPGLRFEPRFLSASRSTAHGARVLWPLGYMGRWE